MKKRERNQGVVVIKGNDKVTPPTLLEQYSNAEQDAQMLNVLLQGVAESTTGVFLEAALLRSIERAEREAFEVKQRYEGHGER